MGFFSKWKQKLKKPHLQHNVSSSDESQEDQREVDPASIDPPEPEPRQVGEAQERTSISSETHFTPDEIDLIQMKLQLLGLDAAGAGVTKAQFFTIFHSNMIYLERVFEVYDAHKLGKLTLDQLLLCFSVLSSRGTMVEKMTLSFQLMDTTGQGYITKEDTAKLMKDVIHSCKVEMNVLLHLTEDQIHTIVDRTFESIPLNARGHLELRGYFNLGPHYTSRLCDYLTSDVMITTAKSNSKLHMKDIDVSISS